MAVIIVCIQAGWGEECDQITAIIRGQGQSHKCQCVVLSMQGKKAAMHVCMYGYPFRIAMRELDTLLANNRIRLK